VIDGLTKSEHLISIGIKWRVSTPGKPAVVLPALDPMMNIFYPNVRE
jgi:hypothetical protein